MWKKLFSNDPINSITAAAGVVAIASLASRIIGVLRDRILASQFGAGIDLDVYYAAFRLPDFIYSFLILGGLSASFIPLFSQHIEDKDSQAAWRFANLVLTIGLLLVIPIIVLGCLLAPWLIDFFIVPGFNLEAKTATVYLTRIMFLSPLFLGLSGIMSGILQSYKRFFIYSLAPIFYNLGIIFGAIYLVPIFKLNGLAWGVVLGSGLHFLVQLPAVTKLGWRFKPLFDFRNEDLKKMFYLTIPRTLNLLVTQFNLIIITIIASHLTAGSIAIFNLANNLQSLPTGIIGVSFAVAAFPTLSQYISQNKKDKFISSLSRTINEILFFVLPLTIIILALRAQIVRVVLGSGIFNWEATIDTYNTLGLFAVSLFAQSLIPLFSRAWFALKDATTPFLVSLMALAVNAGLGVYFSYYLNLGVPGLALAFSLASILQMTGLWVALRFRFGYLNDLSTWKAIYKIIIASATMVPAIQLTKLGINNIFSLHTFIGVLAQATFSSIIGLAVYLFMQWLLRSEELMILIESSRRRFRWRKGLSEVSPDQEV